jgi:hypothetical protein
MPLGPTRLGFICPKLWFISKNIAGVVVNSAIITERTAHFAALGAHVFQKNGSKKGSKNERRD